jgi:hypothetical protein
MLPVSGKQEVMRLLDGYEDFKVRTLAKVPGRLGKALFMRQCRRPEGYSHWGMLNAYGEVQGVKILRRIDREIHFEVLRAPMDELLSEMQIDAEDPVPSSVPAPEPSDTAVLGTVASRHLRFVCETLGSMASYENRIA